jgi:hypothetical protein
MYVGSVNMTLMERDDTILGRLPLLHPPLTLIQIIALFAVPLRGERVSAESVVEGNT